MWWPAFAFSNALLLLSFLTSNSSLLFLFSSRLVPPFLPSCPVQYFPLFFFFHSFIRYFHCPSRCCVFFSILAFPIRTSSQIVPHTGHVRMWVWVGGCWFEGGAVCRWR
ncbi:hypothetical protein BZA05DRAFT_397698 [Tricharina praecox]|uniref:uncharacterized protein n=1 Tax=Tricharina praecox TaxID=43433 RepID=UPI00221E6954|nr:uncharacterized protein BZA05DRAFT_397698 [Tricharina praecox]KAI5852374.1 hypothetical protein BZA05DRAFT_397698 [Tricharina praecox]